MIKELLKTIIRNHPETFIEALDKMNLEEISLLSIVPAPTIQAPRKKCTAKEFLEAVERREYNAEPVQTGRTSATAPNLPSTPSRSSAPKPQNPVHKHGGKREKGTLPEDQKLLTFLGPEGKSLESIRLEFKVGRIRLLGHLSELSFSGKVLQTKKKWKALGPQPVPEDGKPISGNQKVILEALKRMNNKCPQHQVRVNCSPQMDYRVFEPALNDLLRRNIVRKSLEKGVTYLTWGYANVPVPA